MSDQDQTETKSGGSVVLPAGVAALGTWGAVRTYNKGAESLVTDARNGAEGVKAELRDAAKAELAGNAALQQQHTAVEVLKEKVKFEAHGPVTKDGVAPASTTKPRAEAITKINIAKQTEANAQGFAVKVTHPEGTVNTLTVDKLTGEGKKLLGDAGSKEVTGEELAKLTAGGEKSWVVKTAAAAEKELNASIRKSEAWKKAGGAKAAFGHLETGGKAGVIIGGGVAAVSGVVAVKNLFGGKHADRVEAERTAAPEQGAARA